MVGKIHVVPVFWELKSGEEINIKQTNKYIELSLFSSLSFLEERIVI